MAHTWIFTTAGRVVVGKGYDVERLGIPAEKRVASGRLSEWVLHVPPPLTDYVRMAAESGGIYDDRGRLVSDHVIFIVKST